MSEVVVLFQLYIVSLPAEGLKGLAVLHERQCQLEWKPPLVFVHHWMIFYERHRLAEIVAREADKSFIALSAQLTTSSLQNSRK